MASTTPSVTTGFAPWPQPSPVSCQSGFFRRRLAATSGNQTCSITFVPALFAAAHASHLGRGGAAGIATVGATGVEIAQGA
jgi:hypothetical protein